MDQYVLHNYTYVKHGIIIWFVNLGMHIIQAILNDTVHQFSMKKKQR